MTTERCRQWRALLGAYALGQLPDDERVAVEAHLDGCPECRAEAESVRSVALLLPLADPARIVAPTPRPPAELRERIEAVIGEERASGRRERRRRRLSFGFAGAAVATAAAALAIVAFTGGGGSGGGGKPPEQRVAFQDVPRGVEIDASLQPHAFGTEIRMYVSGVRSGTLCRVFLRGTDGRRYPAGSFRYRWGEESQAMLSSALDLARTEAIGVRAGNRTFIAPVARGGATASVEQANEEEPT
jgi:hypothetical protein